METKRKLMAVMVANYFLIQMLTEGWESDGLIKCTKGIPKDAEYIYHLYDPKCQAILFIFRHDSFRPLELGEEIPLMDVIHHRYVATPVVDD